VVVVAVNNICFGCKQKDVEKESFPLHGVVDVVTVLKKKQGNNISKNCLTHFLYSGKIVFTVYAKTCTVLITWSRIIDVVVIFYCTSSSSTRSYLNTGAYIIKLFYDSICN
jgi:hypothetical protein